MLRFLLQDLPATIAEYDSENGMGKSKAKKTQASDNTSFLRRTKRDKIRYKNEAAPVAAVVPVPVAVAPSAALRAKSESAILALGDLFKQKSPEWEDEKPEKKKWRDDVQKQWAVRKQNWGNMKDYKAEPILRVHEEFKPTGAAATSAGLWEDAFANKFDAARSETPRKKSAVAFRATKAPKWFEDAKKREAETAAKSAAERVRLGKERYLDKLAGIEEKDDGAAIEALLVLGTKRSEQKKEEKKRMNPWHDAKKKSDEKPKTKDAKDDGAPIKALLELEKEKVSEKKSDEKQRAKYPKYFWGSHLRDKNWVSPQGESHVSAKSLPGSRHFVRLEGRKAAIPITVEIRSSNLTGSVYVNVIPGITTGADFYKGVRTEYGKRDLSVSTIFLQGRPVEDSDTILSEMVAIDNALSFTALVSKVDTKVFQEIPVQIMDGMRNGGGSFILNVIPGKTTGSEFYKDVRAKFAERGLSVTHILLKGELIKDSYTPLPETVDRSNTFTAVTKRQGRQSISSEVYSVEDYSLYQPLLGSSSRSASENSRQGSSRQGSQSELFSRESSISSSTDELLGEISSPVIVAVRIKKGDLDGKKYISVKVQKGYTTFTSFYKNVKQVVEAGGRSLSSLAFFGNLFFNDEANNVIIPTHDLGWENAFEATLNREMNSRANSQSTTGYSADSDVLGSSNSSASVSEWSGRSSSSRSSEIAVRPLNGEIYRQGYH